MLENIGRDSRLMCTGTDSHDEPLLGDDLTSAGNWPRGATESHEGCFLSIGLQYLLYYYIAHPVVKARYIIIGTYMLSVYV